ncbi:MAG: prolipoprotein diacylglyceryl transferase [Mycobacterium sp.]|nr:prolipoprotein diacylglyceryl transferase [Mycobacterium sp.]
MTTSVLAYIPSPAQGVWHLGPVPLRAYALCIIVGIVAALIVGDRRWVARGGQAGVIYDIALWAVPFGLIGGRLYHVMTDWRTYFGDDGAGFGAALRIWDGGLGIWGAVALGGVGAWIGCRSRGIPLPAFGDAIAPGIVLAQAIGRLGNYFNQELYGRATTLPWGLEIYERRNSAGVLDSLNGVSTGQLVEVVHPTFLYELLWNLLIFAVLIYVDRRFKIGHGRLFALYVAGYCVGRFWVELMRSDMATHIAGIRINTFTSTFVFIAAVVYIMVAPKGREDPESLKGNDDEESPLDEIGEELVAVAATSGVVAAATVAGAEDKREDAVPESAAGGDAEPATVAAAAAAVVDVDESESEDADAPAEADEDPETDDAEDEVDIEGAEPIGSEAGPMSEQAEELAAEQEDEPEEADESEAAAAGGDAEAESIEAAEEAIESEGSEPDEAEDEDEPDEAENEPEAVEAEPEPDAEPAESPELAEVKSDAEPEPDAVTEAADTEAAPVATEPEPEEGLGSVEGDEVVEAQQDAPEVHEAAVEGAEHAEAVAEEVAAEAEDTEAGPESSEAEPEPAEPVESEPEEGLGSVEGDEVVAAGQDAPEVHEAAVEGAEEAEAVAADVAAESESAESDPKPADEPEPAVVEPEPADAAEPESDGADPADAAEPEEGLGSVEGDEVVAAEQDAPEVHEAAVEGAEEAEAVAEEVAAEPAPVAQPGTEPPRARWWRRRG